MPAAVNRQTYLTTRSTTIMRIPDLGLFAVLIIGIAAAEVEPRYKSNIESSKDLLSTLQKMHSSLGAQIAELSHTEAIDNSERTHLQQHYIAQRNNIEREIASIQSIDASHLEMAAPRHILKTLSAEEKIVPSLLNIFKKPKNPGQEQNLNENTGYSLPYSPYYPGYGQQYPYPYYNGQPTKPEHSYPSNDLVHGTFPGHEPPNGNHHQQTFINREQPAQSYQTPPAEQVSLQAPQQYTPPSQVMLQPLAQPPQPEPQRTQPQLEPFRISQAVPQSQQYQAPPQFDPYRPQPQREPYRPQPEPYRPPQQQYQPQVQLMDPYRPNLEEQPHVEPLLRPQPVQNRPQLGAPTDLDAQVLQQSPFGQKQGVFVYYPNGVIDDEEEEERPTIADRFGMAFDRVGQVISSLANRQTLRSSSYSSNVSGTKQRPENSPDRRRVTYNRPRSNNEKLKVKPMDKTMMPTEKAMMPTHKPKMSRDKQMVPTERAMMPTDIPMMPTEKPKMRWVSV